MKYVAAPTTEVKKEERASGKNKAAKVICCASDSFDRPQHKTTVRLNDSKPNDILAFLESTTAYWHVSLVSLPGGDFD